MKVFQSKNGKIVELKKISGKKAAENEKNIQNLIEHNLSTIFPSLELLKTEYQIDDLRPDSIAFDNDTNSFVIVEYKNVKHGGVVDQGMSYYNLLKDRKESFTWLYQKINGKTLDKDKDVNWDEGKVIFISPEYNVYQKRASQASELPIELYKISKYDDEIMLLDKIENKKGADQKSKPKDRPIIRMEEYSEEKYLNGEYENQIPSEPIKKLYFDLKNRILNSFSDVECKQKKKYVKFYSEKNGSAICTIEVQKDKLKLSYSVRKPGIIPVNSFVEDYTGKGHWGIGNYLSKIKNALDVEKAFLLIVKAYEHKAEQDFS